MAYIPTGNELIDPFRLLEQSGIRAGMKLAELGCGTLGHYVFPASQLVGEHGKVYAIDILKSVLSGVESRMKIEGATNVETLWADIERDHGVKLDDGAVDMGLLINNIFMSKQRDKLLKESARIVRVGGWLLVVEWKTTGSALGPDTEVRVAPDEAKRLATSQGLILEKEFDAGEHHYALLFKKPYPES
jgi:ubiquinone/menaquinone biosynthesis C-methylase UbiE